MKDFIAYIIAHLDTLGIVLVGSILIYQKWASGSNGLRKEINEEYKERNKQLEEKVQSTLDEIHKTNLVVAELRGTINEKDKHIQSLTEILQGRNPEMIDLLKEIKNGNHAIQEFMKTTYNLLAKSSEELGYQTELLENSKERNTKIDQASQSHVGDPVRVPPKGKKLKAHK